MTRFLRYPSVGAVVTSLVIACGGNVPAGGSSGPGDAGLADAEVGSGVHVQGDVIERRCVFGAMCPALGFYPLQPKSLVDCLNEDRFRASVTDISTDRWIACAATATTCDAWTDCLTLHHGDYCATHHGDSCADNIAFHCFNEGGGDWPPENCALAPGTSCEVVTQDDLYRPYLSVCTTGKACKPGDGTETCLGDRGTFVCAAQPPLLTYVACNEFHYGQFDAIRGSETCTATQGCVPAGPLCTKEGVTCDGTIATDCRFARTGAPTIAVTYDCAKSGQRCQPRGPGRTVGCAPIPVDCDPATFTPSCAGTTLNVCALGKVEHIDCAAYGFRTCNTTPGQVSCTR